LLCLNGNAVGSALSSSPLVISAEKLSKLIFAIKFSFEPLSNTISPLNSAVPELSVLALKIHSPLL